MQDQIGKNTLFSYRVLHLDLKILLGACLVSLPWNIGWGTCVALRVTDFGYACRNR